MIDLQSRHHLAKRIEFASIGAIGSVVFSWVRIDRVETVGTTALDPQEVELCTHPQVGSQMRAESSALVIGSPLSLDPPREL